MRINGGVMAKVSTHRPPSELPRTHLCGGGVGTGAGGAGDGEVIGAV